MKSNPPFAALLLITLTIFFIVNIRIYAESFESNLITNRFKFISSTDNLLIGAKAAKSDLDLTLSDMLTYAMQDEYLAKSRNELIKNKFGQEIPFANIIKSEISHIASLKPLFSKYKVPIPPDNSRQHIEIPDDLRESFKLGMYGEIESMEMYERFLKENIPADVKAVFTELRDGALSHLV